MNGGGTANASVVDGAATNGAKVSGGADWSWGCPLSNSGVAKASVARMMATTAAIAAARTAPPSWARSGTRNQERAPTAALSAPREAALGAALATWAISAADAASS